MPCSLDGSLSYLSGPLLTFPTCLDLSKIERNEYSLSGPLTKADEGYLAWTSHSSSNSLSGPLSFTV